MRHLATPAKQVNREPVLTAFDIERQARKLAFEQACHARLHELDVMAWGGAHTAPVAIEKLLADATAADIAARAAFDAYPGSETTEKLDLLFAMKVAARDLCHIKNLRKDLIDHQAAVINRRAAERRRRETARKRARDQTNADAAAGIVNVQYRRKPKVSVES